MQCYIVDIITHWEMNMIKEQNQEQLDLFANDLLDVIENYQDSLQTYEIVHRLITDAVSISLTSAPNLLAGMKTIMSSVECGIIEFEKDQNEAKE